jgi:hypothetical protein
MFKADKTRNEFVCMDQKHCNHTWRQAASNAQKSAKPTSGAPVGMSWVDYGVLAFVITRAHALYLSHLVPQGCMPIQVHNHTRHMPMHLQSRAPARPTASWRTCQRHTLHRQVVMAVPVHLDASSQLLRLPGDGGLQLLGGGTHSMCSMLVDDGVATL